MSDNSNPRRNAGALATFAGQALAEITRGKIKLASSHRDGVFGAISTLCNHAGGPLGPGRLEGDYEVCPWQRWEFRRGNGQGEPI